MTTSRLVSACCVAIMASVAWADSAAARQGSQRPPAPQPGGQPSSAQAALAEAQQILQKDPAAAAKILEAVTEREPANARAWTMLGSARHQTKQFEGAIEAYQKSLALQPNPAATYNVAAAYARLKNIDAAVEWLTKAKATGRVDLAQVATDSDFAEIKADARVARLLPTKADFANPFVEATTIVHEWHGEAPQDQFGWIARGIGDVDKDGATDFVTSAPFKVIGGQPTGRIYAYSSTSGKLLWKADGAPGERLGVSLEAAGDVNRDGIGDVVSSAPFTGKAYVFSGANGAVLLTLGGGDVALSSVSTAGDVNNDGHADILAGAAPRPPGTETPGKAFVFSGKNGAVLLTLDGERAGDRFGAAVAGHTSGKQTLLVVGAPGAGDRRTGRVYVYSGLASKPAFTIDSDDTGVALGAMFVAVPGDVDRDGHADVYASDFPNRASGPSTGRIYVHSGKTGARLLTLTGGSAGDGFGTSASSAGDLDGDGHADFAVGAWQHASAAPSGGRIYLHSGKDGRLLRTITCRVPFDTLGFDSVGIGDVNADGVIDLLLTSANSGINGFHSGRIFIVSSGVTKTGGAMR